MNQNDTFTERLSNCTMRMAKLLTEIKGNLKNPVFLEEQRAALKENRELRKEAKDRIREFKMEAKLSKF